MFYEQQSNFNKWFPSNITHMNGARSDMRLICLHGAGMEQGTFSSMNKARNVENALINYCRDEQIEFLSLQLPGRMSRRNEECLRSVEQIVLKIMNVLQLLLEEPNYVPYAIIGYSMGCFCAYELIHMIKSKGLPLPKHFFISCMVSPDYPVELRPWKEAKLCDSKELQAELKLWGANEAIFDQSIWEIYEDILRADLGVIDNYRFDLSHTRLDVAITCFYASDDKRVSKDSMKGWINLFRENTQVNFYEIPGSHSFPYNNQSREIWMRHIISTLEGVLSDLLVA